MATAPKPPAGTEFGRFLLLPHRRELLADGQPLKLGGRYFVAAAWPANRPLPRLTLPRTGAMDPGSEEKTGTKVGLNMPQPEDKAGV